MKNILVPTDFSNTSLAAMEVAVSMAVATGASITVLHVVEEVTPDSYSVAGQGHPEAIDEGRFNSLMIRKAHERLERLVKDPRFAAVEVNGELKVGNPFHGIKTIIAEHAPDLVVMGTRGHTKMEEMIIGSNAEKVVRLMHCPVLTVHKKPAKTEFKKIVYATSMSEEEVDFARVVKQLQARYKAQVHLVRINTPGDFQRDRAVLGYMEQFAKKVGLTNFTRHVYNDLTVEEGIVYFADAIKADLICMATHGRTGFAHVMAGSIAEDVVNHARRPVLTSLIGK
ncbi:MAG: universal stress protein [Bacteroidota bacterium]